MTFLDPSPQLTPLQFAIARGADRTQIRPRIYGGNVISGDLNLISTSVERAFMLVEKANLPKIHVTDRGLNRRHFASGSGLGAEVTGGNSETARQSAALWLAIAQHLEAEEKAAAEEAKKKAAADAKRLDELADEYFDTDYFSDLSTKKQRAVKHIHQLEQELNQEDKA